MSINIGPAATDDMRPRITVIGVGGAGGNAIANMIHSNIEGVEFIVTNTDAQALSNAVAEKRIQLGPDITGGLGAGARPEVGKAAAEETVAEIEDALEGVNMCFIAAGMGGGTGTGAAPVIAEAARRKGVLTVGVVTKPFLFEGTRRMRAAEAGIVELQKHVDTLIVIPNQNLFLIAKADTTFKEAFILADEVLQQGVRSITDLMVMPGLINLDFADVRSVMSEMGKAMMGTGEGEGENRALDAAERAIANPLLDGVSMQGAKGVIISIIGGEDMKLLEVDEAANHIRELVDEDANIIWGSAFNPDLDGKIRVSVVATGIEANLDTAPMDRSSLSLGSSRAPKRPVLELPGEDEFTDEVTPETAESFANLGSFEADEEGEFDEDGDVDGIVDPLAGIRSYAADDNGPLSDPADDRSASDFDGHRGFGSSTAEEDSKDDEPLDLLAESEENDSKRSQDELLLGGGQTNSSAKPDGTGSEDDSARRRGLVAGGTSSAGSTLFERMANLSRGASASREEEEDEGDDDSGDSASLSIPRFLGRQNNQ
ncbi:MAG: cell division protein FtsZ [Allopontixanthobacter sediminis]